MKRNLIFILLIVSICFISGNAFAGSYDEYPECQKKVERAMEADIITGLDVKSSGVQIYVDVVIWNGIPYNTKSNLAQSVSCMFTKGNPEKTTKLEIRSNMTHNLLADGYGGDIDVGSYCVLGSCSLYSLTSQ